MYKTYVSLLQLQSERAEINYITNLRRTCYSGVYPYKIFPEKGLSQIKLDPVTIFYGGNGSGKSTLLNIIAAKANLIRHSEFSGGDFWNDYVSGCNLRCGVIPRNSRILTSDDVSDYILNIRRINNGIDTRRGELFDDYMNRKYTVKQFTGLDDYDDWKESYDAKSKTQSGFVKDRLMKSVQMFSNGESAMKYFTGRITENALYLLDEPENSLSVSVQEEFAEYLTSSARYYGCQFIIATHSPIFLALNDALIYDLDSYPVATKKWTQLENVRKYFDFFKMHSEEFLD